MKYFRSNEVQEKKRTFAKELRILSSFRSLILSKRILNVSLLFSFFFFFSSKKNYAPLYLLALVNGIPLLLPALFQKQLHVSGGNWNLSTLFKKYNYSVQKHWVLNISFFMTILLLFLWDITTSKTNLHLTSFLPLFCLILVLFFRLFFNLTLPFYLRYQLMHGKI